MTYLNNAKKLLSLCAITTIAALTATAADAQYRDRDYGRRNNGPSLELYSGGNLSGDRRVITQDVPDLRVLNFDETANSLVARGSWEVCLDYNYAVRCRTYTDTEIPNLESFRARISSVRFKGGGNYGYDNGYGNNNGGNNYGGSRPVRGSNVTFYPGVINGYSNTQSSANDFCRRQGQREAVYYSGRYSSSTNGLEDVLCR